MESIRRIKAFALATAGMLYTSVPLWACGGWFDDPPQIKETFLDRLPAKTLGQIFVESLPETHSTAPLPDIPEALQEIASECAKAKGAVPKRAIARVDELLVAVRTAQFKGETDGRHINLLHDARDALATAPEEAGDYIRWRVENDNLIKPKPQPDPYGLREETPAFPKDFLTELENRVAAAKGPIRAHWVYLQGALCFNYGKRDEALPYFERVLTEFPKHPRAEFALFMTGRCYLAQSRVIDHWRNPADQAERTQHERKIAHDEALARFNRSLELYPKGRLAMDVDGWLGALAWDEHDYQAALEAYIRQTKAPDHPEILKSAVLMIERTLRRIAMKPDEEKTDEALTLVARHPQVAMGMLYLVLGSPDAAGSLDWSERTSGNPAEAVRLWRKGLLARLATAVAAEKKSYKTEAWQNRCLVILAQAASGIGKQSEALDLLSMASQPDSSDDLVFAKAVALQRSGKTVEAIAAYNLLLERFPSSPLAPGARVKLAIVHRDNHQAGLAVVELRKLLDSKEPMPTSYAFRSEGLIPGDGELSLTSSAIYNDVRNAESDQVERLIDTLLNFAPLPELIEGLTSRELDPGYATLLRAAIAQRALAAEDFATAKQHTTPARYEHLAARIEQLTEEAKAPVKPKERARRELEVGDAWAAATGKLLRVPLENQGGPLYRRDNGMTLGFSNVDSELESRNELRHATHWWLQAARTAPATPLSSSARFRTLETLARIAQNSAYGFARAREADMPKASREIYDRLISETPKSEEARKAAYWSLPPQDAGKEAPLTDFWKQQVPLEFSPDFKAFGYTMDSDDNWDKRQPWKEIDKRVNQLRDTPLPMEKLTEEIRELQKWVAENGDIDQMPLLNCLEDIGLFLQETAVPPQVARRYIGLRLDVLNRSSWSGLLVKVDMEGKPAEESAERGESDENAIVANRVAEALKEPDLKPYRDYLEFLNIALIANHQIQVETGDTSKGEPVTYASRDYRGLEKAARAFLKHHPRSSKREAARLMLARAVFRLSEPRLELIGLPVEGEKPESYVFASVPKIYQREPLIPKKVLAELDAYEREFPRGRYSGDIQFMRADALRRAQSWKPSLAICLRQLKESSPDLRPQFSLCLARIFAQLANPDVRPDLLDVMQDKPEAIGRLQEYLGAANSNPSHPLALLGSFLGERFHFAYPIPEKSREASEPAGAETSWTLNAKAHKALEQSPQRDGDL